VLRKPVKDTARTVRTTGDQVGGEVGEINKPAGDLVKDVTDQAAGAVEDVAEILP
jgi:hypothetical protein